MGVGTKRREEPKFFTTFFVTKIQTTTRILTTRLVIILFKVKKTKKMVILEFGHAFLHHQKSLIFHGYCHQLLALGVSAHSHEESRLFTTTVFVLGSCKRSGRAWLFIFII